MIYELKKNNNIVCVQCKKESDIGFSLNKKTYCPLCLGNEIATNYKLIPRYKSNSASLKDAHIQYMDYIEKIKNELE